MNWQTLMQMDDRERTMISLGLIGIVVAAMLVYVVLPQVKNFRGQSSSRTALMAVAASGAGLPEQITSRMRAVEELTRQLHGDSANLPLQQMESFVIGRLQKLSWDHDIELVSVQPGEGTRVEEFREILFNIELEGGYASVHSWLWAVRRELGFVVIKEFSLARSDDKAQDPRLRATLTMASYRMANS